MNFKKGDRVKKTFNNLAGQRFFLKGTVVSFSWNGFRDIPNVVWDNYPGETDQNRFSWPEAGEALTILTPADIIKERLSHERV